MNLKHKLVIITTCALAVCSSRADTGSSPVNGSPQAVVVSANDQRFDLADGAGVLHDNPGPGSLTFIAADGAGGATHLNPVPVSVVGPPKSIRATPDGSTLLVTCSMRTQDASAEPQQVPDNRVSVIDVSGDTPRLIQTVAVGNQPSGVRVSGDGRYVLVANRAEGTVSVLPIRAAVIEHGAAIKIASPEAGVADIAVSGDNQWILASLIDAGAVVLTNFQDGNLVHAHTPFQIGQSPYALEFIPGTHEAVVADVSERGMLHYFAIESGELRHLDSIHVGIAAEGLAVSDDGNWIAVTCLEHSLLPPDSPKRKQSGRLVMLRRDAQARQISIAGTIRTPRIPQAVTFTTHDGSGIAVGCYEDRVVAFYEWQGGRIVDTGRRVETDGQPAALCTLYQQAERDNH